jgi:hypothetical protein
MLARIKVLDTVIFVQDFPFARRFLTVNTCVNSPEFGVKRQTTGYKLVIHIKINKVRSYSFLKVGKKLII